MTSEEFPDILKKVNVEQKSKEWKDLRKRYITASDVTAIMMFKEGKDYYSKTPSIWFSGKMGKEQKIPPYQANIMRLGELSEEQIVAEYFSSSEYSHGDVYTRGRFLVSLDVFKEETKHVIELKHTQHEKVFNQYANFEHQAYYQLALQMIVMNAVKGSIVVNFQPENGGGRKKAFHIDKTHPKYKEVVDNFKYFRDVHTSVVINKVNPFVEHGSNEFQTLIDSIESRKKKIADMKEDLEIYEDRLLSMLEEGKFTSAKIGNESYKFTLKPSIRTKKTLKEGINEVDVFDFKETEMLRVSKTKNKS